MKQKTNFVEQTRMQSHGMDPESGGITLTQERIRAYLSDLAARGRCGDTIQMYRTRLEALCQYLLPEKQVDPERLADWRDSLLEQGYSPSTVNAHLSAANGLLAYLGRRDLQLVGQLEAAPEAQPELTRTEYLRLLQVARTLDRERAYLLVKVFALTGLRLGNLHQMTVEAATEGWLWTDAGSRQQVIYLPKCLQTELLDYVRRQGLRAGPIFLTRNRRKMGRTQVTGEIQALCHDARVDERKGNPRCLRKLYQAAQAEIDRSVRLLAEQSYERLLDTEQLAVGWKEPLNKTGTL